MKKLYTTPEYKAWHKRKIQRIHRKLGPTKRRFIRKKKYNEYNNSQRQKNSNIPIIPIIAPTDFRLIENTEECLLFFRQIRSEENINYEGNDRFVKISLKFVEKIDYGTISILTSISDDLKFKNIILNGDFPKKYECQKFIVDSGFLNHMVDEKNRKFPKASKSDLIFFEKGCGILTGEDNRKISEMVKRVVNHLTGEPKHFLPVKTIILEICGNSIEHAYTQNRQWLLGVKYEAGKVIFTVTDVGKGILETLYIKFGIQLRDTFERRTRLDILKGAFNQKYGSSTREENRNKGLPSVKANSEFGILRNLKVLTNNVILHFDNDNLSKTFEKGAPRFRGTFYEWEMTKDCVKKTRTVEHENN